MIVNLDARVAHDRAALANHGRWTPVGDGFAAFVVVAASTADLVWHREDLRVASRGLAHYRAMLGSVWAWGCIHRGEGAWNSTSNPVYDGGLQMDSGFQRTYGADMLRAYGRPAWAWHPFDQMIVAERARRSGRGYGPWPNTARACGLL